MKFNRSSVTVGLVVGVLAGGAGGALAATSGSSTTTTGTTTTLALTSSPTWGHGFLGLHGLGSGDATCNAAASYLGLSQSALHTQLESGKTLAQIATARGKSVSGLENAITTAFANRVNADTDLTAAQKSALIAREKSHVDAYVHSTCDGPSGGNGRFGIDRS